MNNENKNLPVISMRTADVQALYTLLGEVPGKFYAPITDLLNRLANRTAQEHAQKEAAQNPPVPKEG